MLNSFSSKLVLFVVVVAVIALIAVGIRFDIFQIQNKDESLHFRSIGDVLADPQKYVAQNITVSGYFLQWDLPRGEGYITSEFIQPPITEGSLNNVDFIVANVTGINIAFNESAFYDFTGTLISSGAYPEVSYILSVKKVELV